MLVRFISAFLQLVCSVTFYASSFAETASNSSLCIYPAFQQLHTPCLYLSLHFHLDCLVRQSMPAGRFFSGTLAYSSGRRLRLFQKLQEKQQMFKGRYN